MEENFELDNHIFKIRKNTLDKFIIKEQKYYMKKINLTEDDVWLDAGACIGAFSVYIAGSVKNVIAYEPDKANFFLMQENLELNNIDNVTIRQKALVNDDSKEIDFFLNIKRNKGAHSAFVKRGREQVVVNAVIINNVIKAKDINKIKMDVEGYEYLLLKSIDCWDKIDEIIVEFHSAVLKDVDHSKYNEIIKLLKGHFSVVDYKEDIKGAWHVVVYARGKNENLQRKKL